MKQTDRFLQIAETGFKKIGISNYNRELTRHIISLADNVIPSFDPEKYDARVEHNGMFVILFSTDSYIINAGNMDSFLSLVKESSLVRFCKDAPDSESFCTLLYFHV